MSSAGSGRVLNFNPGPAGLPESVLRVAQSDFLNFDHSGMSILEMSHRSRTFETVLSNAQADLRSLLSIPENYKIIFMQGGATLQFAAVALNLGGSLGGNGTAVADYVVTGVWSKQAAEEASKFVKVNIAASSESSSFTSIPPRSSWKLSPNASYVHYCHNETVHGVEFREPPSDITVPLVADYSSCFLSGPIDVSKYALIYAGAQKNIGPAGLTIVIVRDDILEKSPKSIPLMMNYKLLQEKDSMYNTPPCFAIYMTGLVLKWIKEQTLVKIDERSLEKSRLLYETIDGSNGFYVAVVQKEARSRMNVVFVLKEKELTNAFVKESEKAGLIGLAGHRSVGGCRASLYNAVTLEATSTLAQFMKDFAFKHT